MSDSILSQEDQAAARARSHKRHREAAALRQYEEREHIRGQIPTRSIVNMNLRIMQLLAQGREKVTLPEGGEVEIELDKTRISSLKAAADLGFKMLAKTVPDLKQIELRADITEESLPQSITYRVVTPE